MKRQGKDLAELIGQDEEDHYDAARDLNASQRVEDENLFGDYNRSAVDDSARAEADPDGEDGDEADDTEDLDADAAENCPVWLPSHFEPAVLDQIPALKRMVDKERQLRRAHCDRRKSELNLSLRIFGVMVRDTKEMGLTTRARATIERQKGVQRRLVKSYQLHQLALAKLGPTDDDLSLYPPLTWELLLEHRPTRPNKPRALGSGKSRTRGPTLPWLTMDVSSIDLGDDDNAGEDLVRALSTDGALCEVRHWTELMPVLRCPCAILPSRSRSNSVA